MKKHVVLVDIDGTLSIVGDRLRHYPNEKELFHSRCDEDLPHVDMCELVDDLDSVGYQIVFVTGRKESVREKTMEWIRANIPIHLWKPQLLMCPDDDHRPDEIVKPELVLKAGIELAEIAFVLEDRNSVVAKWRELGVRCLQVAPGDF